MIVFHLLSGGLSNSAAVNPFIQALQYISPNRYSVELFFRIITYTPSGTSEIFFGTFNRNAALESVGFTLGAPICYSVLVGFIFFFILLGWFTIV